MNGKNISHKVYNCLSKVRQLIITSLEYRIVLYSNITSTKHNKGSIIHEPVHCIFLNLYTPPIHAISSLSRNKTLILMRIFLRFFVRWFMVKGKSATQRLVKLVLLGHWFNPHRLLVLFPKSPLAVPTENAN